MDIRKAYADTEAGQIHYQHSGSGDNTIVYLHWGPGSSDQYLGVLAATAKAGFRGIAPDLPGFGQSCRRLGHWSIGDFADNLNECLGAWGLSRCLLVGGHLAAEIALEAALREPDRIELLVLDGIPTWDQATREAIVAKATPNQPEPKADGSHLGEVWQHLIWEANMWRPNVPYDQDLAPFITRLLKAKLLADFDMRPAQALAEYDAEAALARVRVPVLAMTATDDPLHNCHARVQELVPDAISHSFAGDHPVHSPHRGAEFVAPIISAYEEVKAA